MAKRTAIIDIGSNSARLVIFQTTSKDGFHLICELKSRVRIGEGAYENRGYLQQAGMERAYNTLRSFSQKLEEFKVSKVISVATSALRDAPNRNLFLDKVKKELKLNIDVIDGKEEALFGAIAANNLLPITNGITIDIGGGSTDMSLIRDNVIIETFSLDLGTVRLKELFFDKSAPVQTIEKYISSALSEIPRSFVSDTAIAIGGTSRALAKAIIAKTGYPLNKLHAFEYDYNKYEDLFGKIINSKVEKLHKLHIKENRHDTIREGTLIFTEIIKYLEIEHIITSGVGVREGVYLKYRYPDKPYILPSSINPSIRSIRDRFDILSLPYGNQKNIVKSLYDIFKKKFNGRVDYFHTLEKTLSLSNIGKILTIYHKDRHASYIAMQELNYGFTHEEMILISLLLYTKPKKGYHKEMYKKYKTLLPPKKTIKWLSFIYALTLILHRGSAKAEYSFMLQDNVLMISSDKTFYLAFEEIKEMKKPDNTKIVSK